MKKKVLVFTFLIILLGAVNAVYANNVVTVASSESGIVADYYDETGLNDALKNNEKVKLLSDINISKYIEIRKRSITLDLNEKNININSGSRNSIKKFSPYYRWKWNH